MQRPLVMSSLLQKLKVTLGLSVLCFFFTLKFYAIIVIALQQNLPLNELRIGLVPALGLKQDLALLITSLFYHAGFGHFFSNFLPLLVLGVAIEWTEGSKKMFQVALGSGVIGNILSLFFLGSEQRGSVGFSGAILGMMIYFLLKVKNDSSEKDRKLMNTAVALAFVLFVLPNVAGVFAQLQGVKEATSPVGHLLGAIGGLIMYDLLNQKEDKPAAVQVNPKKKIENQFRKVG